MELKCKKYGKGICKQKVKQKEIVALWTDPERLMPNIVSVQTGLWHGVQHARLLAVYEQATGNVTRCGWSFLEW